MLLPHLNAALRRTTALALAIFMLLPSWAQEAQQTAQPAASQPPQTPQPQQFVLKDYSKPRSHFPNPIGPYMPRYVEPPTLISSVLRQERVSWGLTPDSCKVHPAAVPVA